MKKPHRLGLIFVLFALLCACEKSEPKSGSGSAVSSAEASSEDASPDEKFSSAVPPPEFEFADLNGEKKSLTGYKGKTVLLNFWATWCVPCVAEMASLERLYKTYKDKNFEIVAINVDGAESDEIVKKFVADHGISFTVLRDPELSMPPKYGLSGFPETFFISRQGKFLKFSEPGADAPELRVVGDRAWDSQTFLKAVGDLIAKDQG